MYPLDLFDVSRRKGPSLTQQVSDSNKAQSQVMSRNTKQSWWIQVEFKILNSNKEYITELVTLIFKNIVDDRFSPCWVLYKPGITLSLEIQR